MAIPSASYAELSWFDSNDRTQNRWYEHRDREDAHDQTRIGQVALAA